VRAGPADPGAEVNLDVDTGRAAFDATIDFTVGLEEEFALLDPAELGLVSRFEELQGAAAADQLLADSIAGELIASEIEIRSGRGVNFPAAITAQRDRRRRLFALAGELAIALGATGTHPWSDYRDQRIIDTEHYRRVEQGLKYVAWRNNAFSLHIHVGIRGADRAVRVCDRLRPVLPSLLAISANSPFLDGRDSGLHSARTQIFTRSFPRCGIPDAFGSWDAFARYVDLLARTGSIVEYTQVWWSIRPHFQFGTVEIRICDAQTTAPESEGLAALMLACVAQAARDEDEGVPFADLPNRLIEENMWRAIRYGLDGELLDLERAEPYPAVEAVERLLNWSAPMCGELGIEVALPPLNGAQRQRRMIDAGVSREEVYAAMVADTRDTYAGALGSTAEVTR
jgi:glutamate---cysteine ligase / carboxylate-amine ligase